VVSPADQVYAALAQPCYKITITENGDEPIPDVKHYNNSITIIVDEIPALIVTPPPAGFETCPLIGSS